LVESHFWSTVNVDHYGLRFFWGHVLKRDWQWINIIKASKVKSLPDILTVIEVEQLRLISVTGKLCCRVFLLKTCTMSLRLSETLTLQVGDIETERNQVACPPWQGP
jgi:integrase/recombinase XerD